MNDLYKRLDVANKTSKAMELALKRSAADPGELDARLFLAKGQLDELDIQLHGEKSQNDVGSERQPATMRGRLYAVSSSISRSTYGPTGTSLRSMEIIETELAAAKLILSVLESELDELRKALAAAGAPAVEGR